MTNTPASMKERQFIQLAKPIWDYLVQSSPPHKADVIFVFGGSDILIGRKAAQLLNEGFADLIIATGSSGPYSKVRVQTTEADMLAQEAIALGVPDNHILKEYKATNTGENVEFGMQILAKHGFTPATLLLVAKPFLLRRCLATFSKQFPHLDVSAVSPEGGPFVHQDRPLEQFALRLAQEVDRLKTYSSQGFIVDQQIPEFIDARCEQIKQIVSAHEA